MRHCKGVVFAILLSVVSSAASACSCVKRDPSYIFSAYATIFVGEVTASDAAHPEQVTWLSESISAVPITVKVIESLKGKVAGDRRLLQVGRPSSCSIGLAPGDRRVFLIWKPDQKIIGNCDVKTAAPDVVEALKAAAKDRQ